MNVTGNPRESHLLTEDAVGERLGCSVALLRKWRRVGGGPAFCRIGRLVRYPQADLAAFIEAMKSRAVDKEDRAA